MTWFDEFHRSISHVPETLLKALVVISFLITALLLFAVQFLTYVYVGKLSLTII